MSWLWKDKKTEQLKSLLNTAFEDDKKATSNRLTKIKNDSKLFKSHVEAAFSDSRVTTSKFNLAIICHYDELSSSLTSVSIVYQYLDSEDFISCRN